MIQLHPQKLSLQVNDLVKLVHVELETMTTIYFIGT